MLKNMGHFGFQCSIILAPKPNFPIIVECTTIKNVLSLAAEDETATLFHNARIAIPIRNTLLEMVHPQGSTPAKVDNTTTTGFVHSNICSKQSKAWDMRYHCMKDKVRSKELHIYWDKGSNSKADYLTKYVPPHHHRLMHPKQVLDIKPELCSSIQALVRGCVTYLPIMLS